MQNRYNKIIQEGIEFIIKQQLSDGSFESFSSTKIDNFSDATIYHTNFITAIILEVFANVSDTPVLYQIKMRAAKFLLSQKSKYWSWNYWSKSSKEFTKMPYPDDLDDTFCALNALFLFNNKLITGSAYARIVQLLTNVEEKEGGPYKTWLISQNTSGWDDVDIVVNSNVAYLLSLQEITLPHLQLFFKNRFQKKDLHSPYYPSIYPLLYFLSRFFDDKKSIEDILVVMRNKKGYWENPLNTSLAILALLNIKFSPKKLKESINYLLETQKNHHWNAYAFCIDPAKKGKTYYAGSPALTTAFCLAAISLFQQRINETKFSEKTKDNKKSILKKILDNSLLKIEDKEISKVADVILKKIISKDTSQQIPLMPFYFLQTINDRHKKIKENDILLLGVANVLGWLAFTIYDDFLDEEGNPKLLPLANIYLRRLTQIFDTAFIKNTAIASFFHSVLDNIEKANFWEISHCRVVVKNGDIYIDVSKLPDYENLEQLAHKSLGHGLGSLTILLLLGYKRSDKEFTSLYSFFIHYLIAKQLHDDAHDWEKDLSKGHISFAVALLLKKAKEKKIITTKKIKIKKIIPQLQKLFWYEIIKEMCLHIYSHVKKAQDELESSSIILNKDVLEDLLMIYRKGADKALEEKKRTVDFLKIYKQ